MSRARNRNAWRLVARQHGIVARVQLLALGFSAAAIQHRIDYGRLHPVMRGIYAVGWPYLDRRRRWAAAVLAAATGDHAAHLPTQPYLGDGAALSHRSAAALWGIGAEQPGRIDLSVRRTQDVRRSGLLVRRRPSLPASEIRLMDDLPVTSPVQTLVDMASELDAIAVERAVNDADKRDLIDPESLRLALNDHAGEPGVRPLRQVLDKLTFRLSDSELEIYFRPIDLCRPPLPPQQTTRQRLRGRLLLARPRPHRRDRRPPLPPHPVSPETRRPARPHPRHRRHDPAPLHPLRGPLRTPPRPRGSHPGRSNAPEALPTLTTHLTGVNVGCDASKSPRRRRRPCIRRRPRASPRRPRRSRRWRRARRGSGAAGCRRRGRRPSATPASPPPPPGRATP